MTRMDALLITLLLFLTNNLLLFLVVMSWCVQPDDFYIDDVVNSYNWYTTSSYHTAVVLVFVPSCFVDRE